MKIKNSHLIIVFLVLAIAVAGFQVIKNIKSKGNLKTSFFDIDTSSIKSFEMYSLQNKNNSLKVIRDKNIWFVEVNSVYRFEVSPLFLEKALGEFSKLKPSRLVTNDKNQWQDYNVDSSGTLLIIETTNKKKYKIILGKLGFQNEKYINTYVRIPDEAEVYASECYMEGTFKSQADQWRKKEVLPSSAVKAEFISYSKNKIGFIIENKADKWFIFDQTIDSSLTNNFLSILDKLNNLGFAAYDIIPTLKETEFTIKLGFDKKRIVNLSFFNENQKYYILSDYNKGNFMEIDSALSVNLIAELNNKAIF